MKVLVTGATGFLGSHLVTALKARGDEVVALVRDPRRARDLGGVTLVEGDLLDRDALARALTGCEGLYHCAGKVSRDAADNDAMWRVHVLGTRALLEAARAAGVRRAVVASTSGTIAISDDPSFIGREDDPPPHDFINRFGYYRSKLYGEIEALKHNRDGLAVVVVNPSLLLGPGDRLGSSTGDVKRFLEKKIPAIPAGGMAFVDARDAADGMVLAMALGAPGQRYLLNASNCTMRAFFGKLERVSGVKAPAMPMPRGVTAATVGTALLERAFKWVGAEAPVDAPSAEMGQLYWYCDASRAERDLGWSPRDPIATLADTVDDLREAHSLSPVWA